MALRGVRVIMRVRPLVLQQAREEWKGFHAGI